MKLGRFQVETLHRSVSEMLNVYKEGGRAYHALLCASVVQKRRREESYLEGGQEGCRWKVGLIETRINKPDFKRIRKPIEDAVATRRVLHDRS